MSDSFSNNQSDQRVNDNSSRPANGDDLSHNNYDRNCSSSTDSNSHNSGKDKNDSGDPFLDDFNGGLFDLSFLDEGSDGSEEQEEQEEMDESGESDEYIDLDFYYNYCIGIANPYYDE